MSFKILFATAATAALLAVPALAGSVISVEDAYARSSGMMAKAGAAFMTIVNSGDSDDQLIGARTDAAKVTELHTHIAGDGGVMKMRKVEGGFTIPAGGKHMLMRGGDHVMLMGLTRPLEQGDTITLTLIFEDAGEITIEVPVDLERGGGMNMNMGSGDS